MICMKRRKSSYSETLELKWCWKTTINTSPSSSYRRLVNIGNQLGIHPTSTERDIFLPRILISIGISNSAPS